MKMAMVKQDHKATRRYSYFIFILMVKALLSRSAIADQRDDESGKFRADRETYLENSETKSRTHGTVYATAVGAPIGRLLLMRKGSELCAIRFTEYHRGGDGKPTTMFHAGDETLYAEYDWFELGNSAALGQKENAASGHEKLVRKPIVGFGHLRIKRGEFYVKCGSLSAEWVYPNEVSLIEPYGVGPSNGIDLAPTQWCEIQQVDRNAPSLVWYKYDDNRRELYLPLGQLPGS